MTGLLAQFLGLREWTLSATGRGDTKPERRDQSRMI